MSGIKMELNTWREKVLEGYFYQLKGNENIKLMTGYQGAINYGTNLEKDGFTDSQIQDLILITMDKGLFNTTEFHPLSKVTWYKKEENE